MLSSFMLTKQDNNPLSHKGVKATLERFQVLETLLIKEFPRVYKLKTSPASLLYFTPQFWGTFMTKFPPRLHFSHRSKEIWFVFPL